MISIHKGAPVSCIRSESTRAAALISDVTEGVGRLQGLLFLSLQKANKKNQKKNQWLQTRAVPGETDTSRVGATFERWETSAIKVRRTFFFLFFV